MQAKPHSQLLHTGDTLATTNRIDKVKPLQPLMDQLPLDRFTPFVRPFTYTGLDYFGPVTITIGQRQEKGLVALFTCLTVRALPLEVAHDLSTDACILAIRNCISRRGTPVRMRSDNGKNFVGLNGDVKQFSEVFDCIRIQNELSSRNIQWIFNCPLNPSEGGIWERMVKSVKRVLKQTVHEKSPKEHMFNSFLIEAENIVNSMPLTHIPISAEDEEPNTPNHFLLVMPNTVHTPSFEDIDSQPKVLRKQWKIARQMRDHFWKR
ncbi:uncharacterized protein LOC142224616 [Haematobia irritans]|uniref:uncharacterized protein LOC142224616 n=1 Tax=Haematobia irritans TaxID=7368 RepID=UPI003F509260